MSKTLRKYSIGKQTDYIFPILPQCFIFLIQNRDRNKLYSICDFTYRCRSSFFILTKEICKILLISNEIIAILRYSAWTWTALIKCPEQRSPLSGVPDSAESCKNSNISVNSQNFEKSFLYTWVYF